MYRPRSRGQALRLVLLAALVILALTTCGGESQGEEVEGKWPGKE